MARPLIVTAPMRDGYRTCITFGHAGAAAVGVGQVKFPLPWDATLTGVIATVTAAPGTNPLIVDVNYDGTTVFTNQANRPTIDAGDTDSQTPATPDVVDLVARHHLTVDIDAIGTGGSEGTNLVVVLNVLVQP